MKILFIVLNETEYLQEILDGLFAVGVRGATIIDSQGMGNAITKGKAHEEPFYGSIRSFLNKARPYNKTIFSVINDETTLQSAVEKVQSILGDMHKPGIGIMFTMPVDHAFGI